MTQQQSLSRHFYSIDEVQAALYYTSMRSIHMETLFWAQEMILSGLYSEAVSTLFESWVWQRGPFHLDWLIQAADTLASNEIVESDILVAAYQLSSLSKRDHSLWSILVLSTKYTDKPPDRITQKTPHVLPSSNVNEIYFVRALYQGKAECAWWMARYFSEETLWSLLKWYVANIINVEYKDKYYKVLTALQSYELLLSYRTPEYDIVVRCLAVLTLSLRPTQQEHSFKEISKTIHERHQISKWPMIVGTKAYRIYTIPTVALYGTTHRGRSQWSQQNYECLNNVEKYMKGCPFWDDVIASSDPLNREAFYQEFFPDDIPDEWTKADKQKSHGDGLLAPNERPNLLKYARNHLSRLSRMCWVSPMEIHKIVEESHISICHPTAILSSVINIKGPVDKKWLQPVIKKLIV